MKALLILNLLCISIAFSQEEKKADKIYTQAEFDAKLKEEIEIALEEKVDEEVSKRIEKTHPKNLVSFAKELLEKEKKIQEAEKMLKIQEDQMRESEKDLANKTIKLEKRQKKVLGCIDDNDNKVKGRLNHIVKVVSNMKPVNAAQVLSAQDPDISVKILGMIDAIKAAKIFNLMDKEISARLQKQYMNMQK